MSQRTKSRQKRRSTTRARGNPAKRTSGAHRHAGVTAWIFGARPQTLPLAVSPVAIGSGAAVVASGGQHPGRALLCLIVAVCLQIGANYSNDYSDGIRGTDTHRVGPLRLTASGSANPRTVLTVAMAFFGVAGLAGLALIILSGQWWLLVVGVAAILAAYYYAGGRRPYGYFALGEVAVFLFFGLVATIGSTYVQAGRTNDESVLGGIALGLIASAVLMVNNMRDSETDRAAGKRTLSTLVGPGFSKVLFCVFMLVPFGISTLFSIAYSFATFALFGLLIAVPACLIAVTATSARELALVSRLAVGTSIFYALVLGAAFAF